MKAEVTKVKMRPSLKPTREMVRQLPAGIPNLVHAKYVECSAWAYHIPAQARCRSESSYAPNIHS